MKMALSQQEYFRQFMDRIRDVPSELTCDSEKVENVLKLIRTSWKLQACYIFTNICVVLKSNKYTPEEFENVQFALDMFLEDVKSLAQFLSGQSDEMTDENDGDEGDVFLDLKMASLIYSLCFINGSEPVEYEIFQRGEIKKLMNILSRPCPEEIEPPIPMEEGFVSNEYMEGYRLGETVSFEINSLSHQGTICEFYPDERMLLIAVTDGRLAIVHEGACSYPKPTVDPPSYTWIANFILGVSLAINFWLGCERST